MYRDTATLTPKAENYTRDVAGEVFTTCADTNLKTRELNDNFRRNLLSPETGALGELFLTAGVAALPDVDIFALVDMVRCFEDFTYDNDPYGEHDFGRIDFHGARYFWKIDTHPNNRALTIMRADEY